MVMNDVECAIKHNGYFPKTSVIYIFFSENIPGISKMYT